MSQHNELITNKFLAQAVTEAVEGFLAATDSKNISNLYQLILQQVEKPLLEAVMPYYHLNQVRAAKGLGLSRGTLRKMLKTYFGNKFLGQRDG